MTQLRFLLEAEIADAMWSAKDRLRREIILSEDPLQMHRTRFEQWTKAAAAKYLEVADSEGVEEDIAVDIITKHLARVHTAWHEEAKRRHAR